MIKRVIMCVLCSILLNACDTGGGNPPNVTANNESYTPINLDTATEGTTGMIISGAVNHNTGNVNAFWIRLGDKLVSYRNLEVETRNGYLLRFTHLAPLEEGTHPINTPLDTLATDDNIAAGLLYLWSPDEAQQFTLNPQGTLTVRYIGETILASFTMTAENLAGESVSIEGRLATQETGSAVITN